MLGVSRGASHEQIRIAYRLLAKQLHPDVNTATPEALRHTQQLNAAYEILGDPERREAYDAELARTERPLRFARARPVSQDVHLRFEEFLRGTTLDVRVNDPGNNAGPEVYSLFIPAGTAPGTRFKIARTDGSTVAVRVCARPEYRFKSRGSDLRCDLRISNHRAAQGGTEFLVGPLGTRLRVEVPHGSARGKVLRIPGEGLPKARGGRGALLVRIVYRPEVRITRALRR